MTAPKNPLARCNLKLASIKGRMTEGRALTRGYWLMDESYLLLGLTTAVGGRRD